MLSKFFRFFGIIGCVALKCEHAEELQWKREVLGDGMNAPSLNEPFLRQDDRGVYIFETLSTMSSIMYYFFDGRSTVSGHNTNKLNGWYLTQITSASDKSSYDEGKFRVAQIASLQDVIDAKKYIKPSDHVMLTVSMTPDGAKPTPLDLLKMKRRAQGEQDVRMSQSKIYSVESCPRHPELARVIKVA